MTEGRCSVTDCGGTAVYEGRCVGHLISNELADYVAHLGDDDVLDARGAPIDQQQCRQLVDLLAVSEFTGVATLRAAQFTGYTDVGKAQFTGDADFSVAKFTGETSFRQAQFASRADFSGAQFANRADFGGTQFTDEASFRKTNFNR